MKNFPGLKQFFADMKASGKKNLEPATIRPTAFSPWIATLAFVNVTKDLDTSRRRPSCRRSRPRRTSTSWG